MFSIVYNYIYIYKYFLTTSVYICQTQNYIKYIIVHFCRNFKGFAVKFRLKLLILLLFAFQRHKMKRRLNCDSECIQVWHSTVGAPKRFKISYYIVIGRSAEARPRLNLHNESNGSYLNVLRTKYELQNFNLQLHLPSCVYF